MLSPLSGVLYPQGVKMKKVLKYLGIGILSVVIFFVGIAIFTSSNSVNHEQVFVPYIEKIIPELTTWEQEAYKTHMSKKAFEGATKAQWNLYLSKLSQLGSLQSIGLPELQQSKTFSSMSGSTTTYAVYLVPVTFDTGLAHVQLSIESKDDKIQINSVKFLSDILML